MGKFDNIYNFAILYFIIFLNIIITLFTLITINFYFGIDIQPILTDNFESLLIIFKKVIPFIINKIIEFIDNLNELNLQTGVN